MMRSAGGWPAVSRARRRASAPAVNFGFARAALRAVGFLRAMIGSISGQPGAQNCRVGRPAIKVKNRTLKTEGCGSRALILRRSRHG
jgi:hypothetical protein